MDFPVSLVINLCKLLLIIIIYIFFLSSPGLPNSVVQSLSCIHPTLCDPMDFGMPGFPVLHYLPEFAQIHVH